MLFPITARAAPLHARVILGVMMPLGVLGGVYYNSHQLEILNALQGFLQQLFWSLPLPDDHQCAIGMRGPDMTVSHRRKRWRVDNDPIEGFSELDQHVGHPLRLQNLKWLSFRLAC